MRAFETELYQFIEIAAPAGVRAASREKKQLDDQLKAALDAAVKEFARGLRGAERRAAA